METHVLTCALYLLALTAAYGGLGEACGAKLASLEMSNKTIKDVEHLTRHKSLFVDQNSNTLLGYKKRTSVKNNFDFHNTFFKKIASFKKLK